MPGAKRVPADLRGTLCLVTDRSFAPPERFLEIVDLAIDGGVNMVQLRDKEGDRSTRRIYEDGLRLRALCAARRVPLIVNDRLDLAMALGADGVHLGRSDLPVPVARRLWPGGGIFGASAAALAEAREAVLGGADYVGFGAVYSTATKPEAGEYGLDALELVSRSLPVPVIAIGGIGIDRAAEVMERGCAGIAVVSAVWGSPDPRAAAAALAAAVRAAAQRDAFFDLV